jgi:c-opsin
MVAVMVAAFLVTWVPYSLMAIVKIVSALDDQFKPMSDMQSMALYLPALLAKSSIIYNPIIYAVFNTQVCFKFLFRLLKCTFKDIRME